MKPVRPPHPQPRKVYHEDDEVKRLELLFTMFFDLAAVLKIDSDMSTYLINVSTAGVLDAENIHKALDKFQ